MSVVKQESITIRIERSLKQKLEELADYESRTLSNYIRNKLKEVVEIDANKKILRNIEKH